jgi:hypothetical protein
LDRRQPLVVVRSELRVFFLQPLDLSLGVAPLVDPLPVAVQPSVDLRVLLPGVAHVLQQHAGLLPSSEAVLDLAQHSELPANLTKRLFEDVFRLIHHATSLA